MSTTAASRIQRLTSQQETLVRKHLEEMMTSHVFAVSRRAQDLLRLIVDHALAGESESLRERMIGVEMFNRPVNYDTANDSVVRVKATELRKRLNQYYLESPSSSAVRIEVPPGSYVPRFVFNPPAPHAPPEPEVLSLPPAATVNPETDRPVLPTRAAAKGPSTEYVSPSVKKGRMLLVIAACLCLLGLTVYSGWKFSSNRSSLRPGILSIAVLPFENLSGDTRQDYFADGMTEVLIADLGEIDSLRVVSRTSSMSFKGTKKALPEIARELSVGGVVEGSVTRDGAQVRVAVRLIDAKSDRPIWSKSFIQSSSNLLASEGELAQSIANELSLSISPQTQAHLTRAPSVQINAEDLYLQGMVAFDSGNFEDAMEKFRKAIEVDPDFANPYAGLASCYGQMGIGGWMPYSEAFSNQKSSASRAIELDQSLSEGHAEMADALINMDWNWGGAEKEFRQALDLNPNSATVYERYASYLELSGKSGAAIDEAKIAVKLDPLSEVANNDLAYIYYFSHQYDQALFLLKQAQAKDPSQRPDDFAFADVYAEKGMYQEAISGFLILGNNPHALGHLGNTYARAGQTWSGAGNHRSVGRPCAEG